MKLETDRTLAVATPAGVLLAAFVANTLFLLLPPVLYFIYRRRGWALARETALKLADLNLSLLLLSMAAGLILGAIGIVARDADLQFDLGAILKGLLVLLIVLYTVLSYVFTTVKALKGQLHSARLNMGIIEALRGKRAGAQLPEAPRQP